MNLHVTEQEIIEFLQALVQTPTINPPVDTTACAHLIVEKLRSEGVEAEIVEGKPGIANVVGRMRGNKKGKRLLLNAHIDVVKPGENWTVDPFGGLIRDGHLYGRGSCDMKSGVAAMLMALISFQRSQGMTKGEIIFHAVGDEETGSIWGTRHLIEQGIGADADFAINTEPTSNRIELGERGVRVIKVAITGHSSHAGRPHLGKNAISAAARLIELINQMKFTEFNAAFEVPTPSISVTVINGGHTTNVIPDFCEFTIDRRMIPGETSEKVMEELKALIDASKLKNFGYEIDVKMEKDYWNPFVISVEEPIVQITMEAFRTVMGEEPTIGVKAAGTDSSYLVNTAKIPTVIFGPGNEQLSHQPDENVSISDVVKATKVYAKVFDELFSS
jgi:succinyl-diaminopimelate desuccinylase